jgi:hypothetical protein
MSLEGAIRTWDIEVDAKAEELIKRGVPPWVAMKEAVEIVSLERQRKAAKGNG